MYHQSLKRARPGANSLLKASRRKMSATSPNENDLPNELQISPAVLEQGQDDQRYRIGFQKPGTESYGLESLLP